jgi:hypothetical protein
MHGGSNRVIFKPPANASQLRADENCKLHRLQVANAELVIGILRHQARNRQDSMCMN